MKNLTFNKQTTLLKNRDYLILRDIKDNLNLKNSQEVVRIILFTNETLDSLHKLSIEYFGKIIKGNVDNELNSRIDSLKTYK